MSEPSHHHSRLGARLGPRIAQVVSRAMGEHFQRTAFVRSRVAAEGANEFFRGMSREKKQNTAQFWELYLGGANTPEEVEKLLRFITHGQGELSEIMGSLGLGSAVGTSILSALQNYLAPVNQDLIEQSPQSLLDPATAAAAQVRGWYERSDGAGDAAKGGINAKRYDALLGMAAQWPSLSESLELWRRGEITEGEAAGLLQKNGVAEEYIGKLLTLKRQHVGPADAALAVLRGYIPEVEGAEIAAYEGINAEDFKLLVYNTGEPPGLMQLLEAYRRGFIDDARLNLGIRQSRVRDEWHDVVEKLRFERASPADAVNGVVQGHLTRAEALTIAEQGGLAPEDFDWLVENAGNPIAPMQALELYNRGLITKARVEEAIREGRTKDKYIPEVLELHTKLPPVFEVVKMVATGGISPERGAELLKHEGYPEDIIAGLVHAATSEQSSKAKALSATQVEQLYEELAFSEDEALKHLATLGYTPANAKLILAVADLERDRKVIATAITPIKTSYVARHIDESEASTYLDKLQLPSAQRDLLLETWTIERAAKRAVLTPAQIVAANKLGLIPDAAAEQRLLDHGYNLEDARILLDSEKGRTVPAP